MQRVVIAAMLQYLRWGCSLGLHAAKGPNAGSRATMTVLA